MTICVLEGDLRKPYWESQLDNRSVASCRSLWALLELQVSRWIPRSSAKRMVLIMKGVVETTSLIVSIKSVPLRGDPWGMPLFWEWMVERWLPIRTLNDRSPKKLWIRRGRGACISKSETGDYIIWNMLVL